MFKWLGAVLAALVGSLLLVSSVSAMDVSLVVDSDEANITVTTGDGSNVTLQGIDTSGVTVNGDPVVTRRQLTVADQYARDAFYEVRTQVDSLKQNLKDADAKLQVTVDALARLIIEHQGVTSTIVDLDQKVAQLHANLQEVRAAVADAEHLLDQISSDQGSLQIQLKELRAQIDSLQVQRNSLEERLATAETLLEHSSRTIDSENARITALEDAVHTYHIHILVLEIVLGLMILAVIYIYLAASVL